MIVDITAAAVAVEQASVFGAAEAVDQRYADPPALDGSALVTVVFDLDPGFTPEQILAGATVVDVATGMLTRGTILVGPHGLLGLAVGRGYVVEPAGDIYAVTAPQPDRWSAAFRLPYLIVTVLP